MYISLMVYLSPVIDYFILILHLKGKKVFGLVFEKQIIKQQTQSCFKAFAQDAIPPSSLWLSLFSDFLGHHTVCEILELQN